MNQEQLYKLTKKVANSAEPNETIVVIKVIGNVNAGLLAAVDDIEDYETSGGGNLKLGMGDTSYAYEVIDAKENTINYEVKGI